MDGIEYTNHTITHKIEFVLNINNNYNTNTKMSKLFQEYIESLTKQEKLALEIAKEMLGTSFDMERCIGYNKWLKSKNNKSK